MTVYKYRIPFEGGDVFALDLPADAEILHVAEQNGGAYLWARVEETHDTERRQFAIVGTGHHAPRPEEAQHVGSLLMMDGAYVWHIFEALP